MQTDPVQLFIQAWKTMTERLPSPLYEVRENFTCCLTDTPNMFYNLWIQSKPCTTRDSFDGLLGAAGARSKEHAHPTGGIICPQWCPADWEHQIKAYGLANLVPMISMETDELLPPRRPSAELDILRVIDDKGARELAVLNAHAYHMPVELFDCISTKEFWPSDSCAFVGYLDGQPVSCAAALPVLGTVYIALVATTEEARGKGFAETVMRQAIATGQQIMGTNRTTLHASLLGHPVYEAMGYSSSTHLTLIGPES
ncbi:GNAT family N-acetyltransferase [Aestuariibacter salexigens]|uniref:GNAT family N-acetyltransferase n=1 Tax=Aestuariibacter salexigens TaxID=226010 RepID=UPI000409722A|nr:GNAT family N-acetyltransferase [Aestuariibacter salexigens]